MPIPSITGRGITIRRPHRSHAESIVKHINTPDISRFIQGIPYPSVLKDAKGWIRHAHRMERSVSSYHFVVQETDDDEVIGCIALKHLNFKDRNAEVGYWISGLHRRKGYGKEAMRLILTYAMRELKLHRIYAVVDATNIASVKLLESCGFVREGTWRKASMMDGILQDVYAYGILKEEFEVE
jgi:RimJ/RimL family protein N-acetyltransferase